MQGLERISQQPDSSGQPLVEIEMGGSVKYDRLPTDDSSQGRGNVRHRFCCCQTRGVAFNLLVGIVVIANALFIGIEAELGALGPAGPQWTGLKADMQGVGMDGKGSAKFVQAELQHGLNADQHVKEEVEQRLEGALHKNVNVHESLTLPDGSRKLRSAAYTVCEYFFVTFFLLEMLLRFCDLGCKGYCCDYPWLLLDVTVVTTGVLDVLLPFFLEPEVGRITILPVLRMMRVLRILKLFQVFQPLRIIGRAFAKAFTVVVHVALVVLLLDFALAVVLTSLVGQRSHLWETGRSEVEAWFGSIGRSMQTLFAVQTLDGWNHIVDVMDEVIPASVLVPVIVLYMSLCCFTFIGVVTSVISDSFMTAQFREQRAGNINKDLRRIDTRRSLSQLFTSYAKSSPGMLSRTELESALSWSPIEHMLQGIDVITSKQDILTLYDELHQDPAFAGSVKAEHMAEAVTSLVGDAQASSVFDLKRRMVCMALKAEAAAQEAATQKQEMISTTKKHEAQLLEVRGDVADVSQEVVRLKDQVSAIMVRSDLQAKLQDQERQEQRDAMASMMQAVTLLTTQVAGTHSHFNGKIDVIASQIASQSAIHGKVDGKVDAMSTLLGQLSEQVQALKVKPATQSEQPENEVESEAPASESKVSEPAAEPPSRNLFSEFDVLIASETAAAASKPASPAKEEASPTSAEAAPAAAPAPASAEAALAAPASAEAAPAASEAAPSNQEAVLGSLLMGSSGTEAAGNTTAIATPDPWVAFTNEQSSQSAPAGLPEQWAAFDELKETKKET